jgi:ribonuclease BN (tRNA processing enzyme)
MKITVIGYYGAYPEAGKATSGYLLEHNGKSILLDCGSGVLSRIQNFIALEDLDSLVLSHYHSDHLGDVYCMHYAMMILKHMGKRKKPFHIYALGSDPKFETLSYGEHCIAHPIEEGVVEIIHGVKFTFVKTEHPVICLGMRIESEGKVIGYTADTGWTKNLVEIASHSDLLFCECNLFNYQKGAIAGHLTAGEAGKLAEQASVKELILTHLPHHGELEKLVGEAKEEFKGNVRLAYEGLKYEL